MIPIPYSLWLLSSLAFFLCLFRLLRFPWMHRGEELFFSASCALGFMSSATMILGLFGQARVFSLHAAAAATGIAAVPLLLAARRVPAPPPVPALRVYALCAASLLLLPLIWLPPFFYDTLHYHYGLPSMFLRSGFTRPLSWFVESHFPLGLEMLSLVGMADASYLGANLAGFVYLPLCGLGILCLADRLECRRAGWIGLPLFLFSSTSIHNLFLQKNDLGVALFFFAFVYAFLLYRERGGDRRYLFLAAALCGIALGTKYTMFVFAGVIFVPAIARRTQGQARDTQATPAAPFRDALLFLLVAAVVYSPWPLRNVVFAGNPVYPLLNGVFGNPGWSPERMLLLSDDAHSLSSQLHTWKDPARLLLSLTFFPDPDMSGLGASIGPALVGALLFPFFRRKPAAGWAFLRNAFIGCLLAWFLTSWFSRFLLPALPLMALLTGFLVSGWTEKAGRSGNALAAVLAVALVCVQVASAFAPTEYTRLQSAWRTSFRLVGHPERASQLASRFGQSHQAAQFVNARLPESARILFVGETLPYRYRRDIVAPSAFDEHPLQKIVLPGRPAAEIRRTLAGQGFTHLLFHRREWERLGEKYYRDLWKKEDRMAVDRFLADLPVVYSDRAVSIHSLEGDETR